MTTRVVHKRREPYDVYIGRPGPWGNPFSHLDLANTIRVATREEAVARHREMVLADPELQQRIKRELKGKVLGCFCKPLSCHGDILAEVADS